MRRYTKLHALRTGFAILLLLLFMQCDIDKVNPIGAAYFQRDNWGAEAFVPYQPVQIDTFFNATVNTDISSHLYIGKTDRRESRILLHFGNLPTSGTVDTASVILWTQTVVGDPPASFNIAAHVVTAEWDEADTDWNTFDESYIGDEVGNFELSAKDIADATDSLEIRFDIDVDLVETWFDTTAAVNYGIILIPEVSDCFVDFYSSAYPNDDVLHPEIRLVYQNDTAQIVNNFAISDDIFIADGNEEPTADRLYVGNGTTMHTILSLNLDSIPNDATINRAALTLFVDTLLTYPGTGVDFTIQVNPVTDNPWTFPNVALDSLNGTFATIAEDSVVFNLTFLVQEWVTDQRENYGILLRGSTEEYNFEQRALFSNTADPALLPRFEVYYSLPPSSKYD